MNVLQSVNLAQLIDVAAGRQPADLVLRGGRIVNVFTEEVYAADVAIAGDTIAGLGRYEGREVVDLDGAVICPAFIDGHVHIESSLLSVSEFAALVSARGTAAVVADPHEIANVMGIEGIRYMLASSKYSPVRIYVMLSSCVPASPLEGAGAELLAEDLDPLLADRWVLGLAEMMNYPGVAAGDGPVVDKLRLGRGRLIDGHCPGLSGRDLQAYVAAGIYSDHECTSAGEAQEKLRSGMHVMIREGSQARNLDALLPLVKAENADRFMFVTDDKDVEDLLAEGHMDHILRRAITAGLPPARAVRLMTLSPARYFGLRDLGAVAPGYSASLAVLEDLQSCRLQRVYQAGKLAAAGGRSLGADSRGTKTPVLRSTMNVHWLEPAQFAVRVQGRGQQAVHVMHIVEGQLVTGRSIESLPVVDGEVRADPRRDIAKIVVIERHHASGRMGFGFIKGLGLADGAIASSVAHDAHNIVAAGTNDRDLYEAAVHVVKMRGGLCAARDGQILADMPLPIAGLMSDAPAAQAGEQLRRLHRAAADLGCTLQKPFMGLSFMSLSVIGALKVTDQGLIDVERFRPIELFAS
jgi:adenine deaminase